MPWYLTASWRPSAVAHRSTLEVRCRACAGRVARSMCLAPPAVVAWLAEQEACCVAGGERVERHEDFTGCEGCGRDGGER